MFTSIVKKAGGLVVSGVAGVLVVDAAKRIGTRPRLRRATVATVALGLQGLRRAEVVAENVRLATGDVVAEARERIGETAPVPSSHADTHDHDH